MNINISCPNNKKIKSDKLACNGKNKCDISNISGYNFSINYACVDDTDAILGDSVESQSIESNKTDVNLVKNEELPIEEKINKKTIITDIGYLWDANKYWLFGFAAGVCFVILIMFLWLMTKTKYDIN